mmetsp:Transcript_69406/g.194634  ORF Transcript_69406/g.194634 Transcript_69406/m.194634 type:complete len:226 (-) Transcript_69406:7-684(-)
MCLITSAICAAIISEPPPGVVGLCPAPQAGAAVGTVESGAAQTETAPIGAAIGGHQPCLANAGQTRGLVGAKHGEDAALDAGTLVSSASCGSGMLAVPCCAASPPKGSPKKSLPRSLHVTTTRASADSAPTSEASVDTDAGERSQAADARRRCRRRRRLDVADGCPASSAISSSLPSSARAASRTSSVASVDLRDLTGDIVSSACARAGVVGRQGKRGGPKRPGA